MIMLPVALAGAEPSIEELRAALSAREVELAELTRQIDATYAPTFKATHSLQAAITKDPIQNWLTALERNRWGVRARAYAREGDLYYAPRRVRVWIETPHHSTADLIPTRMNAFITNEEIGFSARLSASVHTTVRVRAAGQNTNLDCDWRDNNIHFRVVLRPGAPTVQTIPYTFHLTHPQDLVGRVHCRREGVINHYARFEISNIAKELGGGKLDFGLKDALVVKVEGLEPIRLPIKLLNPEVHFSPAGIDLRVNVISGEGPIK